MIKKYIKDRVKETIKQLYRIEREVDLTINEKFGDFSTNVAFSIAKEMKKSPQEVAQEIASKIEKDKKFTKIEVGGNGFLNFFVDRRLLALEVEEILKMGDDYGKSDVGEKERVLIEYVSANPTGPLVVVNARAAAIGDSLIRILNFAGFEAVSEFYVNDSGHQIDLLEQSVRTRYRELSGERVQFPQNGYHGNYIKAIAKELLDKKIEEFRTYPVKKIVREQRTTLERFNVRFDSWVYESKIRDSTLINEVKTKLKSRDMIYEKDGAVWIRSSKFGDEKDRVLVKSNGEFTYILPDLAYHLNKFSRGFERLINILGPEHHGYIGRMKAGLEALGYPPENLVILIAQQVNLIKEGKKIFMSKREGEFIPMDELLDEVGTDATRFLFLLRKISSHLDFDIDLAKKTAEENPVYYVQYAHARICSIVVFAKKMGVAVKQIGSAEMSLLNEEKEYGLIKQLVTFPDIVEGAASNLEPHRVPFYLIDLATTFHNFYQRYRVVQDDQNLTLTRLALVEATRTVLKNGLNLIGVSAPEQM